MPAETGSGRCPVRDARGSIRPPECLCGNRRGTGSSWTDPGCGDTARGGKGTLNSPSDRNGQRHGSGPGRFRRRRPSRARSVPARKGGTGSLEGCTRAGYHGTKASGSPVRGGSVEKGLPSDTRGTVQQCTHGIETGAGGRNRCPFGIPVQPALAAGAFSGSGRKAGAGKPARSGGSAQAANAAPPAAVLAR